jgi:hypothetical protein
VFHCRNPLGWCQRSHRRGSHSRWS